ncbi:MAG: hypothetical protein ACLQBK_06070 [Candidatus Sulfotelmatobacter sp.]
MTKLRSCGWIVTVASFFALCGLGYGQILNQDQELQVHDLPSLIARSHDRSEVLLTSLDTLFHDREICCGNDSALEDSAGAADPSSLKDVASKLQGRHLLSDGRPMLVTATYLTPDGVNSGLLITWFQDQHAALMQWNSHVYVVHGIVYMWIASGDPTTGSFAQTTLIHKFLLWDTRYSDSRREVVFNRDTDDLNKVQGFLFVQAKPQ